MTEISTTTATPEVANLRQARKEQAKRWTELCTS